MKDISILGVRMSLGPILRMAQEDEYAEERKSWHKPRAQRYPQGAGKPWAYTHLIGKDAAGRIHPEVERHAFNYVDEPHDAMVAATQHGVPAHTMGRAPEYMGGGRERYNLYLAHPETGKVTAHDANYGTTADALGHLGGGFIQHLRTLATSGRLPNMADLPDYRRVPFEAGMDELNRIHNEPVSRGNIWSEIRSSHEGFHPHLAYYLEHGGNGPHPILDAMSEMGHPDADRLLEKSAQGNLKKHEVLHSLLTTPVPPPQFGRYSLRMAQEGESYRYPPIGPPVVKKATPGFPDKPAPAVDVGRTKKPVLEDPPISAAAWPYEDHDVTPAIQHQVHGHIHTGYRQDDAEYPFRQNEAEEAIADHGPNVERSGRYLAKLAMIDRLAQGQRVGDWNTVLWADPHGNVTAHYKPDLDNPLDMKQMNEEHEEAMKAGKPYMTTKAHPKIMDFMRAIHARPDDASPPLIFSDWLDEQGHGKLAERIRTATAARGGRPPAPQRIEQWLSDHPNEHAAESKWLSEDWPGIKEKLNFGPALPYRPRSYHPKPRATDLKESEWGKIQRFFPQPEMGPRNKRTPVRVMLNAIFFRLENNLPLRELEQVAPDFPPWGSLHSLEYRISEAGLWQDIIKATGRVHLLDRLHKLIHSSSREAPYGAPKRVDISGLVTQEG